MKRDRLDRAAFVSMLEEDGDSFSYIEPEKKVNIFDFYCLEIGEAKNVLKF
jgi:hypothetical protein